MLIKIGGHDLVVGCEWTTPGSREDAEAFIRKHKDRMIIDYRNGVDHVMGASPEGRVDSRKPLAGALLLGMASPNAVIAHPLGDGMVWVAAVRGGIPVPGYDRICPSNEADMLVNEIFSYNPSTALFGQGGDPVDKLLAGLEADLVKLARMQSPGRVRLVKLAVMTASVVGVLVAVVGGITYWSMKSASLAAAENERLAALQRMMQSEDRKRAIQQWQATVANEVSRQRAEYDFGYEPLQTLSAALAFWAAQPLSIGGWRIDQMTCTLPTAAGGESQCQVQWVGQANSSPLDAARIPGAPSDTAALLAQRIETKLPLQGVTGHRVGLSDTERMLGWVTVARSTAGSGRASIRYETTLVEDRATLPSPPNIDGLPPAPNEVIGRRLAWSAEGEGPWLRALLEKVSGPGVRVTKIELRRNSNALHAALSGHVLIK